MKITVITISYNCKNVIENTILSVINQSYKDLEYIVIDGASTDGTLDIIKKYKSHYSYWVSEPDKGIYDAMNKGIYHASGDYIIFMNAGDSFIGNDALKSFVPQINDDTIIAYGDIMMVAKRYKYLATPSPLEEMGNYMTVFHQATFTNIKYHKENLFDTSFKSSADYNFFYNAYFRDKVLFQYIPVVVSNFDCVEGTSNANFKRSQRENLKIWEKENDYLFKAKLEIKLAKMSIVMWIKRHLFTKKMTDIIEKKRLGRLGYKVLEL